ncbi:aldehyde dehydrogenase family protein [Neobacillus massiliamazoniensis]|uniref:Aldehyde dehydrogenase n=1 Tax=Neobacillus massiliamazoniensis TaxID=1499688 RepID=A0A0U1NYD6_9BACI|nr:aldehyde dehydrogenase family protein [Neobacillus massiliamazoniensis]CRK82802.1 aldehyde dehydrogenase [Neobacillus massiliamazoniensis]
MMELNMYIDGKWITSISGEKREVKNPANGKVIALAAEGTAEDTIYAISIARKTFESGVWSTLPFKARANYLNKIANLLEENAEEIAMLETLNNGKMLLAAKTDVQNAIDCFRYYASLITQPEGEMYNAGDLVQTIVIREPIGVCSLIVPWNFPLLMASWQIAPALAAGNTIILKPSEITPVTAVKLFEIIEKAGVPAGVANLVLGTGNIVGSEMVDSDWVDKVAFIGGTETGKKIMRHAAENAKKISLELGGKSPNIVFADNDLEIAVDNALFNIFFNSGQVCTAASRLLIEESIHDKFVDRLIERAKKIVIGQGNKDTSEMGPLVSEAHMQKVLRYIEIGKQEGATLACGGNRIIDNGFENGFFVEPTIFTDTRPDMRIVQEEIFGPVLVIQKFKDEEEAITLANDTVYGLAGAVFCKDIEKAMRVVRKIQAGITWVNCYHVATVQAPWGGYKQSGIGRGLGIFALDEFSERKQINVSYKAHPVGWFSN